MLVPIGRGHEHLDVLADDLFGSITKQSLRRRVESIDDSTFINRDDSLDNRLYDRFQASFAVCSHRDSLPVVLADLTQFRTRLMDPTRARLEKNLFLLGLAESRRFGQRKNHNLFTRDGADVVVQAQGFTAGDVLNHRVQFWPRYFDKLRSNLL